jgi:hypothetical protein
MDANPGREKGFDPQEAGPIQRALGKAGFGLLTIS